VGAAELEIGSLDAAAEGDSVADGELADLDAVVGGERLVELEHEVAVVADVLAHGRVGGEHDGAVPERVVVADQAAHLDELHQPLVVVEVVVLVGVHEHEVQGPVVRLLQGFHSVSSSASLPPLLSVSSDRFALVSYVFEELVEEGEGGALAEVDLVGDAGLLDAGQAELVVLAVDVHGQDLQQSTPQKKMIRISWFPDLGRMGIFLWYSRWKCGTGWERSNRPCRPRGWRARWRGGSSRCRRRSPWSSWRRRA
jgi:hypothetical protein